MTDALVFFSGNTHDHTITFAVEMRTRVLHRKSDSLRVTPHTLLYVSTAAWGGQLELQALATGLRVPVEVLTADAPPAVMGEAFLGETDGVALRVCHHRRAFGLGEHYNSAADK